MPLSTDQRKTFVRFDIFTAVTMKNAVFWDVMSRGCCKNRRFEGAYRLRHQGEDNNSRMLLLNSS
jgi:hypothetical protein